MNDLFLGRTDRSNGWIKRDITDGVFRVAKMAEQQIWTNNIPFMDTDEDGNPVPWGDFRGSIEEYREKMIYAIITERHWHDYIGAEFNINKFFRGPDGGVDFQDSKGLRYDVKSRDFRKFELNNPHFYFDLKKYNEVGFGSDIYVLIAYTLEASYIIGWLSWIDIINYAEIAEIRDYRGEAKSRIKVRSELLNCPRTIKARIASSPKTREIYWLNDKDILYRGSMRNHKRYEDANTP